MAETAPGSIFYKVLMSNLESSDCPLVTSKQNPDINLLLEDILFGGGEKRHEFLKWLLFRFDPVISEPLLGPNTDVVSALATVITELDLCQDKAESVKFVEGEIPFEDQAEKLSLLLETNGQNEDEMYRQLNRLIVPNWDCSDVRHLQSLIPDNIRAEMAKVKVEDMKITTKDDSGIHLSRLLKEVSDAQNQLESLSHVKLASDAKSIRKDVNDLSVNCSAYAKVHQDKFEKLLLEIPKSVNLGLPSDELCSQLSDTLNVINSLETVGQSCDVINEVVDQFRKDELKRKNGTDKECEIVMEKIVARTT